MTETPATGQVTDDETTSFLVAERFPVYLRKPTDGQLAVLMMMAGIEVGDGFRSIIGNLGAVEEVMDSLCIPPADSGDEEAVDIRALKRMMARGEIDLEDFFGPAIGIAEKWGDEKEIEDNREARRAAARAPAKKATRAVAQPGRTKR